MTIRLAPEQSRALAVSLLVLVIAAAVTAIALPVWLLNQRYDSILEDHTDRLKRYRQVAALRPAIEEATKAVQARAGRQYYLKAASAALSSAELQGLVTRIVETNQGKIAGSQALATKEDAKSGEPMKISISVQMSASIIPLMKILYALETTQPYLFVDQLTVQANQGRNYRPVTGVDPEYQVSLTVFGFTPAASGKP
jgi:general secretion pathway protein M